MTILPKAASKGLFNSLVIVAALGYFVDIYDLVLFSIVRVDSLKDLGLSGAAVMTQGVFLLNMQMLGMLIGGIFWGILGDKRGRLSVLFGSILLYSIANIANGFVTTVEAYAVWRLIAGIGLAGELGAGITLLTETLPQKLRGYATMIVATVGVSGAVFAGVISDHFLWRTNFFIGGALGLLLLILRLSVFESGLFTQLKTKSVSRGNFWSLFTSKNRFTRYLLCILIGMPLWYVIGILITFSPELSKSLGVVGEISPGKAIMYCYGGLVAGDFASGFLSQLWKSRRKAIALFLGISIVGMATYFGTHGLQASTFYLLCAFLGFGSGYWAIFVTVAAEQFGTNLRSTVAISVPNFVRGAVIPITLLFQGFTADLGLVGSGVVIGSGCMALALFSLVFLEETYHKEMDFLELN
jgi:putative MFS transporter